MGQTGRQFSQYDRPNASRNAMIRSAILLVPASILFGCHQRRGNMMSATSEFSHPGRPLPLVSAPTDAERGSIVNFARESDGELALRAWPPWHTLCSYFGRVAIRGEHGKSARETQTSISIYLASGECP